MPWTPVYRLCAFGDRGICDHVSRSPRARAVSVHPSRPIACRHRKAPMLAEPCVGWPASGRRRTRGCRWSIFSRVTC